MQKFSFLSDTVYFQNGQEVEIHSKTPFPTEVTVQISSSYPDLNDQVFQLKPNNSLLFKYKPRATGFIKTVRVWGAILDFEGFLDVEFKFLKVVKDVTTEIISNDLSTSQLTRTYYDFNGWTNIEIFKTVISDNQHFDFWLSEHDGATYSIISNDKDFIVETPTIYFTSTRSQFIQVSKEDLSDIIICLIITFGGNVYKLQGAQNMDELEQELYLLFSNDSKIQIYRQADIISIYSDYIDRNMMTFSGVNKFLNKTFQGIGNDTKNVGVKIANRNWHYKKVEFNIVANGIVHRPKMIVHFENKSVSDYSFELENDLVVGETVRLYLNASQGITNKFLQVSNNISCENNFSTQDAFNKVFWYIKPTSSDAATFTIKNVISESFQVTEKPELLNLLYSVQITKDEVLLKIYLNKAVEYDYDYEITFQDKLSKENKDYRLSTSYHFINAQQLERKERIVWTTAQTLRSFNIILDGKTIPVSWYDRNYYPNSISLRTNDNVNHFINRSVSSALTLQYIDGQKIGTIILNPGETNWQYTAINDSVIWQIYDNEYLILEQIVTYVKEIDRKPYLRMIFDESLNAKSINYLTLKLDWPVKYDIDLELVANSNTDLKISGKYRMKADQTEMKFRLTPLRLKNKPSFISLQIVSANVEYDNRKYSVIIN